MQVVVERHHARAEEAEIGGRGLAIQMDQDALDDIALLHVTGEANRVVDGVIVGAYRVA